MSVFFFFKQKTAYEMRISDWSSDVCSSDLISEHLLHCGIPQFALFRRNNARCDLEQPLPVARGKVDQPQENDDWHLQGEVRHEFAAASWLHLVDQLTRQLSHAWAQLRDPVRGEQRSAQGPVAGMVRRIRHQRHEERYIEIRLIGNEYAF